MTTRVVQWREAADPDDLREYDAFGPWIYPVRSLAELPRRFRDRYAELAGAELLVKIPRDLDRPQVQPGDDLYRSVLALFEDRLCLLHAAIPGAGEVERTDVLFADVVGFSANTNLLQGRWTLLLRDGGRIDVVHSAASAEVMEKLAGFVRVRIAGADRPLPTVEPLQPSDHLFKGRVRALDRQFGSALPLHIDPRNVPCRSGRGWPKLSTGTMIVFTPTELVIVNRGEAARPIFLPSYAVGTVELPYSRLESFAVRPPQPRSSFHELVLRSGLQEYVQLCLIAPDAIADHLRLLGLTEAVERAVG